jgi:hypothetical protein
VLGLRRAVVAVASWAAWSSTGAPARAQAKSIRAEATGTIGYSAVQTSGPVAAAGQESGPFFAVSPSVVVQYDRPRIEQSLEYAFTLNVPFDTRFRVLDPFVTYANRGTYGAHVYLTPTTELLVGLGVVQAPLNVTAVGSDPSTTPVGATPNGSSYTLQGTAQEALTKQFSETLRLTQSAAFTVGLPFDETPKIADTFAVTNGLSLEKSRERDAFTGSLALTYAHFTESQDEDLGRVPPRDQLLSTLVGSYRRDFGEAVSVQADGGVLHARSPSDSGAGFWSPTGGVAATYARRFVQAQLAYAHMAQVNLLVGDVNLVDQVALRASVPLGRSDFAVSGTAAYEYTRTLTVQADVTDPIHVILADVGITWTPRRVPNLGIGVRASVTNQDPVDPAAVGFVRETVALNVTFGYPTAAQAMQPPYISPIYRAAPVQATDFAAFAASRRPPSGEADEEAPRSPPAQRP